MRLSLKAFDLFFVFYFMWLSVSVINAFTDTLKTKDNFKDKPVESFGQLIRIFVYAIGAIVIISLFIGKTPTTILAGLGAASAILLLIFKDTIWAWWVSRCLQRWSASVTDNMPKYGVDGDVIKTTLQPLRS